MSDAEVLDRPQETHTDQTPSFVTILGGGPAGLGAAYKLAKHGYGAVKLYEAADVPGGNAASFELAGMRVDYGSHRLHPVAEADILDDIKDLLGEDLLLRPRHGRMRLKGSWIHFPLKPVDLVMNMPPAFASALLFDMATAKMRAPKVVEETFETVLRGGLGNTMSDAFYFPYVRKLWGLEPHQLAPTLAHRRVSGSSLPKLMRKILGTLPGLKSPTTGKFYYPREGFGQICDAIADAAIAHGADIEFGTRFVGMEMDGKTVTSIVLETKEGTRTEPVETLWSTLPISLLVRAAGDKAPEEVRKAADSVSYRGMILVYIVLDTDQFTEYDAHYFAESDIPMSRLSEPKNYHAQGQPEGKTILCAELPCDPHEKYWSMPDEQLGEEMRGWLEKAGLPVSAKTLEVHTRRLPFAYPVYDRTFEENFAKLDEWVGSLDNVLTFGRQGLFAHDNTHHALAMAYGAVECLSKDGSFDEERWAELRAIFETHVVED
ncbi:FAD-dependent oxidoreductase [Parvularcula lutaonensis]|uniref:FAD-dependent oxidoreductase n=1 Tax=Parvularcula lutaonensis TaxID=491923 RepID=A0ABV7M950_9PROT|nr:FAD-dependent oxidoreductase [Parvularcula lutaonensis]GGY44446.1 amine oxidase [Parvularcula lutaonensis]